MSVRSTSGAPTLNSAFRTAAQLRLHDVLAVQLGVAVGRRAVELVLLPERDDDLVHERVAKSRDLDPAAVPAPRAAVVTWSFLRSVVDQTPTTAFDASGPLTALWLRVTIRSGIWSTVE